MRDAGNEVGTNLPCYEKPNRNEGQMNYLLTSTLMSSKHNGYVGSQEKLSYFACTVVLSTPAQFPSLQALVLSNLCYSVELKYGMAEWYFWYFTILVIAAVRQVFQFFPCISVFIIIHVMEQIKLI